MKRMVTIQKSIGKESKGVCSRVSCWFAFGGLLVLFALGCNKKSEIKDGQASADTAKDETKTISKESQIGPVKATVQIHPSEPTLGDKLELVLDVEAEDGVTITMPDYDPALGRFDVLKHSASNEDTPDGKKRFVERYSMQATRSGRMRIPRLRIEFEDKREKRADGTNADKGPNEMLTEEIALVVADVLPEEARGQELPKTPDSLDPAFGQTFVKRFGWILIPVLAVLVFLVVLFRWRKKSKIKESLVDPYDAAVARITTLQSQGVPNDEGLDAWYVELSSIVRHYVEGRFDVRAPELTTEEFLRVAQQSNDSGLSSEHKSLLGELLEGCDRVKFGKYRPANEEIQSALEIASKFIQDTKQKHEPSHPKDNAA